MYLFDLLKELDHMSHLLGKWTTLLCF